MADNSSVIVHISAVGVPYSVQREVMELLADYDPDIWEK